MKCHKVVTDRRKYTQKVTKVRHPGENDKKKKQKKSKTYHNHEMMSQLTHRKVD